MRRDFIDDIFSIVKLGFDAYVFMYLFLMVFALLVYIFS